MASDALVRGQLLRYLSRVRTDIDVQHHEPVHKAAK